VGYLRFNRRKQIAPGIRLNLSKSGPSLTFGPRGAHYTIGPRGRRTTVGLPGTGLYYTSTSGRRRVAVQRTLHHGATPKTHPLIHLLVNAVRAAFWLMALTLVAVIALGCVTTRAVEQVIARRRP
jgi:hypothetical protein